MQKVRSVQKVTAVQYFLEGPYIFGFAWILIRPPGTESSQPATDANTAGGSDLASAASAGAVATEENGEDHEHEVMYIEEEIEEEDATDDEIVVVNHNQQPFLEETVAPLVGEQANQHLSNSGSKPAFVPKPVEKPEVPPPTPEDCKHEEGRGTFQAGFSDLCYVLKMLVL